MCEWGTSVRVPAIVPADLSHTGDERLAMVQIDACIAPIVSALQHAGIVTRSSCCGHGKGDGEILLQDGRALVIRRAAGTAWAGALAATVAHHIAEHDKAHPSGCGFDDCPWEDLRDLLATHNDQPPATDPSHGTTGSA